MEVAVKINKINKTMGKRHILKDLSFEVYKGEVFGFLGPNGAGKTTTIKMAVGMLSIDSGKISICGDDVEHSFEKAMSHIGAIVENPEFYGYMSGIDNLKQYARMRGGIDKGRISEVIEMVGLSNRINDKVKSYSLGMRQRLGLAQALIHNPQVIILDEPTNGLDPAGIKELRDLLKELAHKKDIGVIVSSHLMSEMELMCDRVAIIDKGELVCVKKIDELIEESKADVVNYLLALEDNERAINVLSGVEGIIADLSENDKVVIKTNKEDTKKQISKVIKLLTKADIDIYSVVPEEVKSLEQVFIELTKEGGSQID